METQRMLLFVALAFVVLMLWEQWQRDYGPPPTPVSEFNDHPSTRSPAETGIDVPASPALAGKPVAPAPAPTMTAMDQAQPIYVRTDLLEVEISTYGGEIRVANLISYPVDIEHPEQPFKLLSDELPDLFIAQSGLLSSSNSAPNHHAVYASDKTHYELQRGDDQLVVDLHWADDDGVNVIKRFTFTRDSHTIRIEHIINNRSSIDWSGRQYRQLQRSEPSSIGESRFIYTYTGGVIYSDLEKYEKIDFDDMTDADLSRDITGGWAAMIQHYFLSAWVPQADEANHYYTKSLQGPRYVIGLVAPEYTVAAGTQKSLVSQLYIGPKIQDKLEALAPGLRLTVDYGWLTVLAQPLFWLLHKLHGLLGNWGWAIVLVTVCIKAVFYKLSEASYKSMANMRKVTPRMKALKERYADDKPGLQKAMMDMYKTEKINPLGGCLPIMVQIPVFIALYWVLLESVELRQAPFIFWLHDLAIADPYFVLPLLMGVTMLIQQKLNPAPMDPIQAKVMMVLPIVFTVFFAFFPAGLVLYWVVNNTLSIAQQWVITKNIDKAA
jgi:YidC/Oxa1 family membrane protein insertase